MLYLNLGTEMKKPYVLRFVFPLLALTLILLIASVGLHRGRWFWKAAKHNDVIESRVGRERLNQGVKKKMDAAYEDAIHRFVRSQENSDEWQAFHHMELYRKQTAQMIKHHEMLARYEKEFKQRGPLADRQFTVLEDTAAWEHYFRYMMGYLPIILLLTAPVLYAYAFTQERDNHMHHVIAASEHGGRILTVRKMSLSLLVALVLYLLAVLGSFLWIELQAGLLANGAISFYRIHPSAMHQASVLTVWVRLVLFQGMQYLLLVLWVLLLSQFARSTYAATLLSYSVLFAPLLMKLWPLGKERSILQSLFLPIRLLPPSFLMAGTEIWANEGKSYLTGVYGAADHSLAVLGIISFLQAALLIFMLVSRGRRYLFD